ncbi:MAG: hypothetical protein HGA45_20100 [Chloroflexales bacterium]|nr:hypothetical protein [Chloroflexales bacterium]
MTQSEDLFTVIETQIAAAEHALLAATGGTNVCQLDKAGQATGGAKYQEGRLVALRAIRRLVQAADPARAMAQVQQLCDQWRADLTAQQARPQPSLPWLAYTQGGVDALEGLLAAD